MTGIFKKFSPQLLKHAVPLSVLLHLSLFLIVAFMFSRGAQAPLSDDYVDLGYQTFDEPPVIAPVEKKVMKAPEPEKVADKIPDNSAKELQDDKGDVAGMQKAAPATIAGADTNGNATATPYYKIKPKYPRAALVSGTEGWVLMSIDINETGEVENVRIVGGEQKNMFQSEARRAVEQWKYRPFMDKDGKPVKKTDHQVRVDFKLNDATPGSD